MTSKDDWVNDLDPIQPADWDRARAKHLLNRAGFGGTPEDIDRLATLTPVEAVRRIIDYEKVENGDLPAFEHSGVYDPTLKVFPPSRPATTRKAETTGEAIGVRVKPGGSRRMQPVVDRFFFWLRATALETRRIAAWWADRMVSTDRPLQEKMALFWHGHFATGADKVRDYRKMLVQLELFHQKGTGNFRELLIAVAQDPAMLVFLDAGQNVKGAPNENFGREVMELFTMGVGNYSEHDIREAARAFTGWTNDDLRFKLDEAKHDTGEKEFLGRRGNFDGVDILNIILDQKVTANFIAGKIYRYFVRDDLSPDLAGTPRRDPPRERLRTQTAAAHHLPVQGFLQRAVGRHPHQRAGRSDRFNVPRTGCEAAAGRPGFQQLMWRTRSGAAQSADRRRLGPGTKLDYAWHVAGARESGAPDAAAGHDQFRRSQPRSGPADSRGQQPHPARNVGHGSDLRRKSRNRHGR